jgi:hypothetical protein
VELPAGASYCPACGEQARLPGARGWLRYLGWIMVGLLVAVDLLLCVSFFPALVVTVPVTVVLANVMQGRLGAPWETWGVAIGVAALPLFFAYTNRHGPGTYCHVIGTAQYPGTECAEQWDPRPFLVIGVALLLLPIAGPLWLRCRRNHARTGVGPTA